MPDQFPFPSRAHEGSYSPYPAHPHIILLNWLSFLPIKMGRECYPILLICTSLNITEFEHLFMYLSARSVRPFCNCYSYPLSVFLYRLFSFSCLLAEFLVFCVLVSHWSQTLQIFLISYLLTLSMQSFLNITL